MNLEDKTELWMFRMWQVEGVKLIADRPGIEPLYEWLSAHLPTDAYKVSYDGRSDGFWAANFNQGTAATIWIRGDTNAVFFKLRWHDDIAFHVFNDTMTTYK